MRFLKSMLAAVLLCASVFTLSGCGDDKPATASDVAVQMVQNLYDGKVDAIVDMAEDDLKNQPGVGDMLKGKLQMGAQEATSFAKQHQGVDKIEAVNEEVHGDVTRVTVNTTFKDKFVKSENVDVIKTQKGEFKLKF